MPALRNRRGAPARQHHAAASASMQPNSTLPPRLRKRDILLRGPQLLLRGPGLLLRAPQAVWRAPAAARAGTRRFLSGTALRSRQQPQQRPQGIDELSQLHAETSKTAAPTNASEPTQEEARRQSFASASAAFIERPHSLSRTGIDACSFPSPSQEEVEGNADEMVADPRVARRSGPRRFDPVQAGVGQGQGTHGGRLCALAGSLAGAHRKCPVSRAPKADRVLGRSTLSARFRSGPFRDCTASSTLTSFRSGSAFPATSSTLGSLGSTWTSASRQISQSTGR